MGLITTGPGGPLTTSSASGGKIYAFNSLTTTPTQVVAANAARQNIAFHNPGTVTIYVAPVFILNTAGSNVALSPTTSALGGCFAIVGGATLFISGECQGGWQAFSASGSSIPLTVMDSNV